VASLCFLFWGGIGASILFTLPAYPPNYQGPNKRCMMLQIPERTLVTGSVSSTRTNPASPHFKTDFWIDDSFGGKHYQKIDIQSEPSKFAFRTHDKPLEYQFCVLNELPDGSAAKQAPSSDIELDVSLNDDLFDNESAHDAKILPRERDVIHLEAVMRKIVDELDKLHHIEMDLRDTNESTNDRVKYLSILSIIVLVLLCLAQILYLKKYFKTKKLI